MRYPHKAMLDEQREGDAGRVADKIEDIDRVETVAESELRALDSEGKQHA